MQAPCIFAENLHACCVQLGVALYIEFVLFLPLLSAAPERRCAAKAEDDLCSTGVAPEYQVLYPGAEYERCPFGCLFCALCVGSYDRGTLRFIAGDMVSNVYRDG